MKQKKTFEEKERTKQLIIFVWFVYAPKRTDLHGCQIANCPIESERRKVSLFLSLSACWDTFNSKMNPVADFVVY